MPIVLKPGSLNLLETSGPVKVRNVMALPIYFYNIYEVKREWKILHNMEL
jgi:hypothetical protein